MKKILIAIGALLVLATTANAQSSANATASAFVVTPISITKTADLNFGNVAVGSTSGTVQISPGGSRTANGGVTLPAAVGSPSAASFDVAGQSAYTYAIALPSSAVITSGSNTMTVTAFTSNPSAMGTLSSATPGAQTLYVGATLNVGASQPAGTYVSATPFAILVNYN